jgi:hypothetical protein
MSTTPPFILHILVADGDPDGLRVVERSNWNGKAVVFPRALYPTVRKREEFQQPGVYLLIGPREDGDGETIYVGEGDPVYHRLESHYANKDFWTRAVFFVAGPGQLNKAHVQYLEAQLIQRARAAKRLPLANGNTPTEPTLSEMDRAYLEVFLQNLLGILPVLGITAFEQSAPPPAVQDKLATLYCEGKGVRATGHDAPQGFIVRSGSMAASGLTPSLIKHFPYVERARTDLLASGVLIPVGELMRFTQDYTFSSPSMASTIVLGRASNGRIEWKDGEGRTLKSLQEAVAG